MDKHQTANILAKHIESQIDGCTAKQTEYGSPDASRPAEISITSSSGEWLILYVYDDKFWLYEFRSRFSGACGPKYHKDIGSLGPVDFSISDPESIDKIISAIREHFRAS